MAEPIAAEAPIGGADIRPDCGRHVAVGLAAIGCFLAVFAAWSALAPINSGAVAPGVIQVEGERKAIQNLEGGIVREIFVRENQAVRAGETLLLLDDTQSDASVEALVAQRYVLLAQDARLKAERDGAPEVVFPDELLAAAESAPHVQDIMQGQVTLFENRASVLRSEAEIYRQRIAQAESQSASYGAQLTSHQRQIDLVEDELESVRDLHEEGFVPKPRLLELEREAAALQGARDELESQILRARQVIAETNVQISYAREKWLSDIAEQQRDVMAQLFEVNERLRAAADTNNRRTIRAPVDGVVVNLRYPTEGSVVPPGALIMEVVPSREDLIVDARVAPTDIDVVTIGLAAEVKLTALKQRLQPILQGEVISISPDALNDERTGEPYYLAEVRVPTDELSKLGDERLLPGMPAEVVIAAGERTLLQYFVQPLTDSLWRSFREE